MFYNDRLSGKERKQKIALIVCAVVVLAVWLVLTIRINMIFQKGLFLWIRLI